MELLDRGRGLIGVALLLGIAWAMSTDRRRVPWRILAWGIGLQLGFAVLILKTPIGAAIFDFVRQGAARLISFSDAGAGFLFGALGEPRFGLTVADAAGQPVQLGFAIAFRVLPVIVFFSSLMAILYHLGLMQRLVRAFAWLMRRTMRISGAESLAVSANVFVGMVEAPLAVRPYVGAMTLSELACVMTAGFATVAGSVMAAYIGFGVDAGHLLAASVMSAPAAVMVAKLMHPEAERPATADGAALDAARETVNVIDAAASGAVQGMRIAAIVGAMLIAFVSLIALVNFLLQLLGGAIGVEQLTLGRLFGWVFAPVAWCLGVAGEDVTAVGHLLGTKIAVNELVAYLDLVGMQGELAERSRVIATYALCGFANFGSIAITLGGVGALAPQRRADLARLGIKTMIGGALASWLTAAVAGLLV